MTPEQIFSLAGMAALAGWALLILGPRRFGWLNALPCFVIPLGLSLLYAVLVLRYFADADGSYGSLAGVRGLFSSDWVLLAGWVHYLAFDLAIGAMLAKRMDKAGFARLVQAPLLATTFLFGPLGFALIIMSDAALAAFSRLGTAANSQELAS